MAVQTEKSVRMMKNYVGGKFVEPENSGYIDVENPSTGEVIGKVPLSTRAETDRAIEVAHQAYLKWKDVPVARRVSYLFKYYQLLVQNEDHIARVLTRENGKSLPDAHAELKRAIENVEVACGMPVLQQGDNIIGSSFGIDGEVVRLPMGVFTMIAPFNFPAMVPFWFIPYAIASGNTYVVKPSKQVPMSLQLLAEYFDQVGLPAGVFNIVNGDRQVAEAFMENPLVKGVSLVGSTPACREVASRLRRSTDKRYPGDGRSEEPPRGHARRQYRDVVRNMIISAATAARVSAAWRRAPSSPSGTRPTGR